MKVELNKTERQFLDMVLEDVQALPFDMHKRIEEGYGYKPFAYMLQRKIRGEDIKKIGPKTAFQRKIRAQIKRQLTLKERAALDSNKKYIKKWQ